MPSIYTWIPDQVVSWWLNMLFQVTLISGVGCAIGICLRRNAATRYSLLVTVLLLCLLSPLSSPLVLNYGVTLYGMAEDSGFATFRTRDLARPTPNHLAASAGSAATLQVETRPPRQLPSRDFQDLAVMSAERQAGVTTPVARREHTGLRKITSILMLVWGVGLIPFLVATLIGYLRLWFVLRRAKQGTSVADQMIVRQVCRKLGVNRIPTLVHSNVIYSPLAVGVLRPTVILPAKIRDSLNEVQVRSVLTHEIAHIKRRDPLLAHFQHLARVVFWPHPFVWTVNRWLSRSREEVCDNHVLQSFDAHSYSRALLQVAEAGRHTNVVMTSVALLTNHWKLESRVAEILQDGRARTTNSSFGGKSLVMATAMLLSILHFLVVVRPPEVGAQEKNADSSSQRSAQENGDIEPATLERELRTLSEKAATIQTLDALERRARALLRTHDSPAARGRICAQVARSYQASGSPERTIVWAQSALKQPLSKAERVQMFQYWCDASRGTSEGTWNAWLPALFGYLESAGNNGDERARDDFLNRLIHMGEKKRLAHVRDAVSLLDDSALPTPQTELPEWVPTNNACAVSFEVDWVRVLTAAKPTVGRLAGDSDFVDDLLASIRDDPNGPRVDLETELLPHLGDRVTFSVDYRDALLTQEPRLVVGIEVKNRPAVMEVVGRMLRRDPATRRRDIHGSPAWIIGDKGSEDATTVCLIKSDILFGWDFEQVRNITKYGHHASQQLPQ